MNENTAPSDCLQFGEYLLNRRTRTLTYRGEPITLPDKSLSVLIFLARYSRHDKPVSKYKLLEHVWFKNVNAGDADSLKRDLNCVDQTVSRVRLAIHDQSHSIIKTVHQDGYYIVPAVTAVSCPDLPVSAPARDYSTSYVVQPATAPDVKWAARLARRVYSGLDVIREELMLSWYQQNGTGFSVVKSKSGESFGNLDLLSIRPETLREFVAGTITEQDIAAAHLYRPEERAHITDLYVESMVTVANPRSRRPRGNPIAAAHVLADFDVIIRRICNPATLKRVYAIAASRAGRLLLQHLGFTICTSRESRRDHHDLFVVGYPDLERNLQAFFGDGRRDETAMKLLDSATTEEHGL